MKDDGTIRALLNGLRVRERLMDHFAEGASPTELSHATGITASSMTRILATLRKAGFAEQIPETGRWRLSHRIARKGVHISQSLVRARDRLEESITRIAA